MNPVRNAQKQSSRTAIITMVHSPRASNGMKKLLVSALAVVALAAAAPALGQTYYGTCASVPAGLTVGLRGSSVSSLQSFLVSQNYPGGGSWMITGYFGQATAAAVRTFQATHGLPQTGFVDAATAAAINNASCGGVSYPTYPAYPTPPSYCLLSGQGGAYPYNYGYGTNCHVSIRSISPSSADVGDRITMYGSGFSSSGNTARFGIGIAATNVSSYDNGTRLTFTVPSRLSVYGYSSERVYETTYPVSIVNSAGYTSNAVSLRITDADENDNDGDLEISNVSGPSSLDVGERGTWAANVRGGRTDYLT